MRPSNVEAAVRANPHGDPVRAARAVLEWRREGRTRSRSAGVLLAAALRQQGTGRPLLDADAEQAARALPGCDPRQVAGAVATLRWARRRAERDGRRDRPEVTVEAVRDMIGRLYRHEAVGV